MHKICSLINNPQTRYTFQYQKSTNTNKETEETMKVLETDKSIADNKIDKVCQKKEKPTKNSDFTLEEERKTAKELKGK